MKIKNLKQNKEIKLDENINVIDKKIKRKKQNYKEENIKIK